MLAGCRFALGERTRARHALSCRLREGVIPAILIEFQVYGRNLTERSLREPSDFHRPSPSQNSSQMGKIR